MTGGGILALVAYGAQNVILSGNPQMSYFYKAFRRYTHFAMENITIPLEGPNEIRWDSPIQLRAKIPRFGDLLSDLYFSFRIPPIFSKYIAPNTIPGRTSQLEFEWVRYIGAAIIQNAAFFVGGQKIQEFDGSYLLTRALMDMDTDMLHKWQRLVGDVPEVTNPAAGTYAGGSSHIGYPSVFKDSTNTGAQANRPSIFERTIHVPLSFWFTEVASQAIPLVGLQSHECEVQLTLNPAQILYTILDNSGYRVSPMSAMVAPVAQIQRNKPNYGTWNDLSGQIRAFMTDMGVTPPALNTWFLNPRLQGTFIYLPLEEQQIFATKPLSYLVTQVTAYPFPNLIQRTTLDVYTHNPVTRLLFVPRRSDAVDRNNFANFTNWATYPNPPFLPTPGVPTFLQTGYSSGLTVPNAQMDIIRAIRVLCNGNEIQEEKPIDYFTNLTPYKYVTGIGADGLPLYSFQLGQNSTQPSGSINTSKINNFQVDLDLYPLPTDPTYTYDVTIYVENLNWFEVASGMGGLKYAL